MAFIFYEQIEKMNAFMVPPNLPISARPQNAKSHRNAVAFLLPLLDSNQGPTD